jgi:hypothetical protein
MYNYSAAADTIKQCTMNNGKAEGIKNYWVDDVSEFVGAKCFFALAGTEHLRIFRRVSSLSENTRSGGKRAFLPTYFQPPPFMLLTRDSLPDGAAGTPGPPSDQS